MREETVVDSILAYIKDNEGKTAYQIAKALDKNPSDVSSRLKELTDKGKVERFADKGPKGGFAYYLVRSDNAA